MPKPTVSCAKYLTFRLLNYVLLLVMRSVSNVRDCITFESKELGFAPTLRSDSFATDTSLPTWGGQSGGGQSLRDCQDIQSAMSPWLRRPRCATGGEKRTSRCHRGQR